MIIICNNNNIKKEDNKGEDGCDDGENSSDNDKYEKQG